MIRKIKERDKIVMVEGLCCPIRLLQLEDLVFGLSG